MSKTLALRTFRLVASHFPTIQLFEHLLNADELETAYALEALTNPRIRDEVGDILQVPPEERVVGTGSSPIMAAFTHIGTPSRFTDGRFGIYYAGVELKTAIEEARCSRERFLAATDESACAITMRCYQCAVIKPLLDVRGERYDYLYNKDSYTASQTFGREQRDKQRWGLLYHSVRHEGGNCVAVFKANAMQPPAQTVGHYEFVWNGERVTHVLKKEQVS